MKRLLYVDCCIRGQTSRTRRLAEAFLDALPQGWAVEPLELAAEGLQYFSGPFFQQRQDLLAAGNRTHPRFRYAWQFAQADAIVLAAPLWDLSFPALLKVYIENVSVENITFGCGEAGCYGICQARRMVFLTTRGSAYEGSHLEMGSRYLQGTIVWRQTAWTPWEPIRNPFSAPPAPRLRSWPKLFKISSSKRNGFSRSVLTSGLRDSGSVHTLTEIPSSLSAPPPDGSGAPGQRFRRSRCS